MKKLIGFIIAAVFALSLPVFAQTSTDDTKKRTETYGAEGKGQQGEMKRDQERKELKSGDAEKKEQKKEKKPGFWSGLAGKVPEQEEQEKAESPAQAKAQSRIVLILQADQSWEERSFSGNWQFIKCLTSIMTPLPC